MGQSSADGQELFAPMALVFQRLANLSGEPVSPNRRVGHLLEVVQIEIGQHRRPAIELA